MSSVDGGTKNPESLPFAVEVRIPGNKGPWIFVRRWETLEEARLFAADSRTFGLLEARVVAVDGVPIPEEEKKKTEPWELPPHLRWAADTASTEGPLPPGYVWDSWRKQTTFMGARRKKRREQEKRGKKR